jgi:hypothetical protein
LALVALDSGNEVCQILLAFWPQTLMKSLCSFELLLCVLAVYKGYQRFRTIGHQVLHDILVRDSVMYYLA